MRRFLPFGLLAALFFIQACASTAPPPKLTTGVKAGDRFSGLASWYGQEFAGRTTANGEIFDPLLLTAAHRTLPFGTLLRVTNPTSGVSVDVRVNDRGPFVVDRVVDLSYAAAQQLGLTDDGVGPVEITILKLGAGDREPPQPYVVTIPQGAQSVPAMPAAVAARPTVSSGPPEVAFPLPAEPAGSVAAIPPAAPIATTTTTKTTTTTTDEKSFHVEVVEEHHGTETRKQVAPDGKTIESVPVATTTSTSTSVTTMSPSPPAPAATSASPSQPDTQSREAITLWVVQLGAFGVESNATQLRDRVVALVKHAWVEPSGRLFRVRVGPFATKEEAIDARQKLEAAGISGVVMTSDAK